MIYELVGGKGQHSEWMLLGVGVAVGEYSVKYHECMGGNEMREYRKDDWTIWECKHESEC